jgi:hypothetical protein
MFKLLPCSLRSRTLSKRVLFCFPQAGSRLGWPQALSSTAHCQCATCNFSEDGSGFFKANETSWTISSYFPRSKGWHTGGSGKYMKKVTSQHPLRKVLTQQKSSEILS